MGPQFKRRDILKAGLLFPAIWIRTAEASTPIRFGLTPVFLSNDLDLLDSLQTYLSKRLGQTVELVSRRTYQEITTLLVSGQMHAAWICGYPYIQYRNQLDLVATPIWRGKPLYQSYLIAATGRLVEDWRGLRGDTHAFSDPDSNSGFLVTGALLADAGERPSDFFGRSFFTYGHRNVIRAVASGLAQSGSVDGYVYEVMRETEPALIAQTSIVRRSEWLGFPPIAAPKSLAADPMSARLSEALMSMREDAGGLTVLKLLHLDGFTNAPAELFDPIAVKFEKVRALG